MNLLYMYFGLCWAILFVPGTGELVNIIVWISMATYLRGLTNKEVQS